jgi:hypothetical protein
MQPKEFLLEEYESVRRALNETLRFDYGSPDLTRDYYEECAARLDIIKMSIARIKSSDIWALLGELSELARWISYIERSRLGEFSWPFAEEIRKIAKPLLAETLLSGPIEPIIHVIAEGEGYQIAHEDITSSVRARFAIVAFPRPLKHHVLLHTIFGHELGHTAQITSAAGSQLADSVVKPLCSKGHLSDVTAMTAWVHDPKAPTEIKADLQQWRADRGEEFEFDEYYRESWYIELVCDLFGLLLFGPAFAAAHKALLLPMHRTPYGIPLIGPTHPSYAVRHKMLVRAIRFLKWDSPVTSSSSIARQAEMAALEYILKDPYDEWASFFDDTQLGDAVSGVADVLHNFGGHCYKQPDGSTIEELVRRLVDRTPPIVADISKEGVPILHETAMAHTLYAGWIYWLGRGELKIKEPLSFLLVNSLCDQALLQECGIALAK